MRVRTSRADGLEVVYDTYFVSGGTAGCVIARRLAEDSTVTVLLLEAGKRKEDVPASSIPAAVSQILGTDADWNIQSEPCKELNGRQLHLARGKFLSGSSGCNGTLCIRGTMQDYDDWGVDGWKGSQMFDYMKRVEAFRNNDWFEHDSGAHGNEGLLVTSPHDPAPISRCILESFQSKGLQIKPDMFTSGNTSNGCGHAIRSVCNGTRTSAFDYISSDTDLSNLTITTGQYVNRILLEERGVDIVATGVQSQDKNGLGVHFTARKEVVLASGAYGSPAVLLRSGIGPTKELEKLGVKTKVDLPGVGKNLMDHMVGFQYQISAIHAHIGSSGHTELL